MKSQELISLPDIGQRLADKILEIIETGGLWKLDEFQTDNDITTMNLFGQVWGTGPAAAKKWFDQGFRTLDDLRTKAKLTHNQIIGLKYYDEFLERIPREEVSEIEKVVSDAVQVLRPGVIIQTCGSYRRGKASCGDVDVLISHPDGVSHEYLFYPLVDGLKLCGFLTDDLMYSEKVDEEPGSHMKYCGVCLLPGEGRKHRRLDIIIVPYQEYACALLYFTGSTLFNRSMRHLADGMNLYLSQHRLNTGIIRNGKTKINLGTRLPTPTEESIFNYLNLPYRPPHERDH
ncbi:unnamed protein product [Didymodactylos carnosus]|uniref:DNA polymerase n=1 Tax=Didymodactylos carnosus TaxID=1234261 RepID=A0A814P2K7_9BILA|nr:unnamed protein product [Didymodactylos carnosus]CAF1099094.1 unnamed protein product [Didymodactylos carnosus]CAF3678257.1 unnamed protein product [Didymodactylos carnosus]CAF3864131.1 unnamed protein product [Didymodactylos carnosus]